MGYQMTVCRGKGMQQTTTNPSPEAIERAIDELLPMMYHFVILEHDEPIRGCSYIQTLITLENEPVIRYLLEARFDFESHFEHYQTFTYNAAELKRVFRMFALGLVPNVDGWTNIAGSLSQRHKEDTHGESL